MEFTKVFFCMMCIFGCVISTATPPPYHQGPQYTISCLENGDVTLKGISSGSKISSQGNCSPTVAAPLVKIPKTCLTELNEKRSVTLTIQDLVIDGTRSPVPSDKNISNFDGGMNSHTITIECQPLSNEGVHAYVIHGIGVFNGATVKVNQETDQVAMHLKAEDLNDIGKIMDLPDISSVYVGDKFYLYLVYTGVQTYNLVPQKCTAYSGSHASEPSSDVAHIDLWTKSSCSSPQAVSYHIMHNFKTLADKRVVYAEMFGFRFTDSTDHTDITFVCDVTICKSTTGDCATQTCPANSIWVRKKRSVKDTPGIKVAQRIKVYNSDVQNSAGMLGFSLSLVLALLIVSRGY